MARYVVIGGGIVGLATAYRADPERSDSRRSRSSRRRTGVAAHQTGHNSGVIHAGVYYKPGSLKATLCRGGQPRRWCEFCAEHGIPYEICGKLDRRHRRGRAAPAARAARARRSPTACRSRLVAPEQAARVRAARRRRRRAARRLDRHRRLSARCAAALAELVEKAGGDGAARRPGHRTPRRDGRASIVATTTGGDLPADDLVNCAGLHSDRVARLAGAGPPARIMPFRGEYYELRPERAAPGPRA